MAEKLRPIRRVVTGNDERGRSRVIYDGPAPNVNPGAVAPSAGMTDLWVFHDCPAPLSGERDDGNLPFHFEPPERGGHLRIVQSAGRPENYDPARDASAVPLHAPRQRPGGTWDRGGQNAYSSPVHKSATVDYGILRSSALPEVPTVSESGLPGFEAVGVHGLLAPAGTPRRVVDRLNAECVAILRSPEVRAQLASEGAEPIGNTPEQYAAHLAAEVQKWGKLIRERGIRAD